MIKSFYDTFEQILFDIQINNITGFAIREIDRAEDNLGIILPVVFKEFYHRFVTTAEANKVHERFLSPSEWKYEDNHLIFAEENQGVVLWGIHQSELNASSDPIVRIASVNNTLEWHKEDLTVSEFLPFMFLYNLVMGVFLNSKDIEISDQQFNNLRSKAKYDTYDNGMRIIIIGKLIITIMYCDDKRISVTISAKKPFNLDELKDYLG